MIAKIVLGLLSEGGDIYSDFETAIAEMSKTPEGQQKLQIALELVQKLAGDLLKAVSMT